MTCSYAKSLIVVVILARSLIAQEPVAEVTEIEIPGTSDFRDISFQPDGTIIIVPSDYDDLISPTAPQPGVALAIPVPAPTSTVRRTGSIRIAQPLPKEYTARDKNGDGQIGLYEWDRAKYAEFAKLDRNGDGFLTAQELGSKSAQVLPRLRLGADKPALPSPGTLTAYNSKIGETFTFTVTGKASGSVWGTGTYTTDSHLATAAVHAGVLKDGETGNIRVSIVQPPSQFMASTANGVTSSPWEAFPAAYTVSR